MAASANASAAKARPPRAGTAVPKDGTGVAVGIGAGVGVEDGVAVGVAVGAITMTTPFIVVPVGELWTEQ